MGRLHLSALVLGNSASTFEAGEYRDFLLPAASAREARQSGDVSHIASSEARCKLSQYCARVGLWWGSPGMQSLQVVIESCFVRASQCGRCSGSEVPPKQFCTVESKRNSGEHKPSFSGCGSVIRRAKSAMG